jgi:spore coat protein H
MARRLRIGLMVASAVVIALGASVRPARAQTSADLFAAGKIQEVRLFVNSKDLAELRARYQENIHFPADLQWGDTRVRNVSVRSRGSGSRNPTKLGLLVEFGRYTTGQKFLGLSSLVLDNAWQDVSFVREQVAMGFFNRMGLPAPREAFCRLYINNVPQGLYVLIENLDEDFLTRALGENKGYLFEFHWDPNANFYANYLGDALDPYKPLFEPRTHTLDADTVLYSPLRDLFREINAPMDEVWRSRVEQYLDLNQFMTFTAVEIFLAEYDGLTGNWGMNNFYLYRRGSANVHQFIPWDRDLAMTGQFDSSIFLNTDRNILFQAAMAIPELREQFYSTLELCAQRAVDDDWLVGEISRSTSLISDAVHADTLKNPFPGADPPKSFDAEVPWLLDFAQRRPAYVRDAVAKARAGR